MSARPSTTLKCLLGNPACDPKKIDECPAVARFVRWAEETDRTLASWKHSDSPDIHAEMDGLACGIEIVTVREDRSAAADGDFNELTQRIREHLETKRVQTGESWTATVTANLVAIRHEAALSKNQSRAIMGEIRSVLERGGGEKRFRLSKPGQWPVYVTAAASTEAVLPRIHLKALPGPMLQSCRGTLESMLTALLEAESKMSRFWEVKLIVDFRRAAFTAGALGRVLKLIDDTCRRGGGDFGNHNQPPQDLAPIAHVKLERSERVLVRPEANGGGYSLEGLLHDFASQLAKKRKKAKDYPFEHLWLLVDNRSAGGTHLRLCHLELLDSTVNINPYERVLWLEQGQITDITNRLATAGRH